MLIILVYEALEYLEGLVLVKFVIFESNVHSGLYSDVKLGDLVCCEKHNSAIVFEDPQEHFVRSQPYAIILRHGALTAAPDTSAQRDAILGAGVEDFREFSHAGWWHKNGKNESFWSPENSIGSILHSNLMLVGKKFREHCNTAYDDKEIGPEVARRAVSRLGFGYTPTLMSKRTHSAEVTPKTAVMEKGTKGKSQDNREDNQQRRHPSRHRGRSLTTTENHNQQEQQGSSSKIVIADTPTKKYSERTKKPVTRTASTGRSSSVRSSSSSHRQK